MKTEKQKLVDFFRSDEGDELGRAGDHDNLTPAETAIRAMRELIALKKPLGTGSEVILDHLGEGPVRCRITNVRGPYALPPGQPLLRVEIIGSNPDKSREL